MLARALATHYLPTRLTATHLHVAVRSAAAAAAKTPPHTYTPALQPFSPPSTTSAFPLTLLEANLSPQRPPFQAPVLRTLHSSPYSPAAHPFISHPENQPRRAMSSTGGGAAAAGGGGGSSRSTLTLRNFTKLCDKVAMQGGSIEKKKVIAKYSGAVNGKWLPLPDLELLFKMLLPSEQPRVYGLKDKSVLKVFSVMFGCSVIDMQRDLDISGLLPETIVTFFEKNTQCTPASKSKVSLAEVDAFLAKLEVLSSQDDMRLHLDKMARKCTATDMLYLVRLIKHDLRTNARASVVIGALGDGAYDAFKANKNLSTLLPKIVALTDDSSAAGDGGGGVGTGLARKLSSSMTIGQAVTPQLASAIKSTEAGFKKCPNGCFAEIKYDGERIQIHMNEADGTFSCWARSCKPAKADKVEGFEAHLRAAFPGATSMILDSEVLVIDNVTGKFGDFGSLGTHKRKGNANWQTCLVVFDVLLYNGEEVVDKPFIERRKLLEKMIQPVKHKVMLSELKEIETQEELDAMFDDAVANSEEGLMLKDAKGKYEVGKRRWMKVKADHMTTGNTVDTADLVVLGGYYGTGGKGGTCSVFLLGCHDQARDEWRTVTKVGNGFTDAELEELNNTLVKTMRKTEKDKAKIPSWLLTGDSSAALTPDFVVRDPKTSPIWEIKAAEYTPSTSTGAGISMRFPRVVKVRDDKDWKTATNLTELKALYDAAPGSTASTKKDGGGGGAKKRKSAKAAKVLKGQTTLSFGGSSSHKKSTDVGTGKRAASTMAAAGGGVAGSAGDFNDSDEEFWGAAPATSTAADAAASTVSNGAAATMSSKRQKLYVPSADGGGGGGGGAQTHGVCKFGAGCFRTKNKAHCAEWWHPGDAPLATEAADLQISLERIFTGKRVLVEDEVTRRSDLERLVRAYDGIVVSARDYKGDGSAPPPPTHVVRSPAAFLTSPRVMYSGAHEVSPTWVHESMRQQRCPMEHLHKPQ